MLDLSPYLKRPISTLAAIAIDPIGSWDRFYEQFVANREGLTPPETYLAERDWESRLCKVIGITSPDNQDAEFFPLWTSVIEEMRAKGVRAGPESFKGWNDGDAAFVRTLWRLVRSLKPTNIVETGVAHGVTSRLILEALERNGSGQLWSIDRPPMEAEWKVQVGIAVSAPLKGRWTYVFGSSRRRLPALLDSLGRIDLFIHDSLHSERNVRFELDQAWRALRPGGAVVVDDIDTNRGFHSFTAANSGHLFFVGEAEPLRPDLRRFNGKGLFGVAVKNPD
jgi:predicted O-methyltransferase YrrM